MPASPLACFFLASTSSLPALSNHLKTIFSFAVLAVQLWCIQPPASAASIWREGEEPTKSTVQKHNWYDSVKKDVLSGGNWLSHYGEQPGEASYAVEIAEAGNYTFWARLNPVASQVKWALNGAAWQPVTLGIAQQQQNIAGDGKIDHRFIAWVKIGVVPLVKGKHTIAFRFEGGVANSGGLDCFVLTTDKFVPQGTMKPGEASAVAGSETEADPKDAIWIEGEAPSRHTMNRHPWWYDQVKKDVLSGGDWISNFSKDKDGTADYDFTVLTADSYAFWIRANPMVGAQLDWKLDGSKWTPVDFKDARGQQNIAADNKPDMRFIAWVKAPNVKLAAGKHTITFRMAGAEQNSHHGGLDCFVFTRIPFVPAGAKKPTIAKTGGGPGDWFPLLADEDTFDPRSVIDMSRLVPAPAGQFGFLKANGKDLKFEKASAPVKLWGCGANVEPGRYSREQLAVRAKYLRKFGINTVRQHAVWDELNTNGKIDPQKLDQYDWWFAELKKNGIYTDWSVFYHWTITRDTGYPLFDELDGSGNVRDTYGVITAAPALWELRNKVVVELLNHKNPYTGLRYADDPALAVVEMQNEDSIFFWNPLGELASDKPKKWAAHAQQLRKGFAGWAKAKYKTDDALKSAWGALKEGDSVNAPELRLMTPWELDGKGPRGPFTGMNRRAGDVIEFLAELQHAEFESAEKAIRSAGFKAVTMTTAWQVGGSATDPANIWTDSVGSMIDRHNYAGGGDGGHGIAEGKVNNESHLATPGGGIFTVGMKQVESKPFSVTEWTQSAPNQWKAECAPIMAFYALGLQGWDASWHFMQSGTRLGDGWPGMSSYTTDTPAYLGQFPALAFALYRGHIVESPPVAARRLSKAELFTGLDALKQDATKGGHDVKTMIVDGGTPLEAFAIGRVTVDFKGGKTEQADFAKFWDQPNKIIRSVTGELTWDYGRQLITVQTPKTQAVIGRPGAGLVQLPGVAATFKTPFVSTIFTPLDDLPLAQSKHILITALAQDKQTGARYNADGTRLESVGTAPLLLEPVQATLRFAGAKPAQVNALDHYGVPTGKTVPIAADGSITINGTFRAYYYEVNR